MQIVVNSCFKYRDAWPLFFGALEHFWPEHPKVTLVTDRVVFDPSFDLGGNEFFAAGDQSTWCSALAAYASTVKEPILLMQEDFFITEKVRVDLADRCLRWLVEGDLDCIRLYPMPGAGPAIPGEDPQMGMLAKDAPYRISCQAAIWRPDFLAELAARCAHSATFFEVVGNQATEDYRIAAWRRDVFPWPIEYLCSGITAGRWTKDSKRLAAQLGIQVDFSMRGSE